MSVFKPEMRACIVPFIAQNGGHVEAENCVGMRDAFICEIKADPGPYLCRTQPAIDQSPLEVKAVPEQRQPGVCRMGPVPRGTGVAGRVIGVSVSDRGYDQTARVKDIVAGAGQLQLQQSAGGALKTRYRPATDARHTRILPVVCGKASMEDGRSFRKGGAACHKYFGRAA